MATTTVPPCMNTCCCPSYVVPGLQAPSLTRSTEMQSLSRATRRPALRDARGLARNAQISAAPRPRVAAQAVLVPEYGCVPARAARAASRLRAGAPGAGCPHRFAPALGTHERACLGRPGLRGSPAHHPRGACLRRGAYVCPPRSTRRTAPPRSYVIASAGLTAALLQWQAIRVVQARKAYRVEYPQMCARAPGCGPSTRVHAPWGRGGHRAAPAHARSPVCPRTKRRCRPHPAPTPTPCARAQVCGRPQRGGGGVQLHPARAPKHAGDGARDDRDGRAHGGRSCAWPQPTRRYSSRAAQRACQARCSSSGCAIELASGAARPPLFHPPPLRAW